jgi:hypothetical protein
MTNDDFAHQRIDGPPSSGFGISVLASLSPFVVTLWTLPVDLLRANWGEFDGSVSVLTPFVGTLLGVTALITFLLHLHQSSLLINILSVLGIAILGFFSIAPGGLSEGSQGAFIASQNGGYLVLAASGSIFVAGALLYTLGGDRFVRACAGVSTALLLMGGFLLLGRVWSADANVREEGLSDAIGKEGRPNVYHILLDGFSSDLFLPSLRATAREDAFTGFTFFTNTHANYTRTQESLPSLLTGTLADLENMQAWSRSFQTKGVLASLQAAGYRLWNYGSEEKLLFQRAKQRSTFASLRRKVPASLLVRFTDVWLARVLFPIISESYIRRGVGPLGRRYGRWTGEASFLNSSSLSRLLLLQALEDEELRADYGESVYLHLLLPHSPYALSSTCEVATGDAGYVDQSECSLRLVAEYLDLLKKLGRFDSSLIVVHSDHGEYFPRPTAHLSMSPQLSTSIQQGNIYGFSGYDLERRAKALLLVKPPRAAALPLTENRSRVQLLDLAPTIIGILGLPRLDSTGLNVIGNLNSDRIFDLFDGFVRINPHNEAIERFGEQFFEGELNHYRVSSDSWSEAPRPTARW